MNSPPSGKQNHFRMMRVRGSSFDRISELPSNTIEIILKFLPLRDAVRTSILSRKWRFRWAKVSQLVFDCDLTFKFDEDPRDIVKQIYDILLLHQGPILKFTLDMDILTSCSDIDKIIIFLSRNGIQELTLSLWDEEEKCCHKLPSYIFSCQQLKHLSLKFFVFKPPPTFKGFSKLISLELRNVDLAPAVSISRYPLLERLTLQSNTTIDYFSIDAPNLKILCFIGSITYISFINTPLLALLSLTAEEERESSFDLIKLLDSLPLIENLHMNYGIFMLLAVSNVPEKLPTMLNYLRTLELSQISFTVMDQLSSALCLIWSSPNLQKLKFKFGVVKGRATDLEPVLEYLGMQDYSDYTLNKLGEVEIEFFTGLRPNLEFIKLLLAISPELETVRIKISSSGTYKTGYMMLKELARYRRASRKAEIIFHGLDEDMA